MNTDCLEFLGGLGYGVVEGVTKTFVPASKEVFAYMDGCIKDVSGTATIGRQVGEKASIGLLLLL